MPEIKVTKHGGFKYGVGDARQQYGKGAVIIVKQKDARVLVAAKLAEYVDGDQKAETKAPRAAPKAKSTKVTASKVTARKKTSVSAVGRYNRRDMRAK